MRYYEFTVVFTNHGFKKVMAFNKADAVILAKAEMIKDGCSHNVAFVKGKDGEVI